MEGSGQLQAVVAVIPWKRLIFFRLEEVEVPGLAWAFGEYQIPHFFRESNPGRAPHNRPDYLLTVQYDTSICNVNTVTYFEDVKFKDRYYSHRALSFQHTSL